MFGLIYGLCICPGAVSRLDILQHLAWRLVVVCIYPFWILSESVHNFWIWYVNLNQNLIVAIPLPGVTKAVSKFEIRKLPWYVGGWNAGSRFQHWYVFVGCL